MSNKLSSSHTIWTQGLPRQFATFVKTTNNTFPSQPAFFPWRRHHSGSAEHNINRERLLCSLPYVLLSGIPGMLGSMTSQPQGSSQIQISLVDHTDLTHIPSLTGTSLPADTGTSAITKFRHRHLCNPALYSSRKGISQPDFLPRGRFKPYV